MTPCPVVAASAKPLIENMAWCWWTRPRATRIGSSIYFGAIESGGGIVAARYDLDERPDSSDSASPVLKTTITTIPRCWPSKPNR